MTRLVFRKPPRTAPVRLVFGGSSELAPPAVTVHAQAELLAPTFVAGIVYDNRVSRLAVVNAASSTQHGAPAHAQLRGVGAGGQKAAQDVRERFDAGAPKAASVRATLDSSVARAAQSPRIVREHGTPVAVGARIGQLHGASVATVNHAVWEVATVAGIVLAEREERPGNLGLAGLYGWQHGVGAVLELGALSAGIGVAVTGAVSRMPWEHAANPRPGRIVLTPEPPGPEPYTPTNRLVFQCPVVTAPVHLVFGHECRPAGPVHPGTVIILPQRRYFVNNNVQMRRVSDNALVLADNIAVGIDYRSWTWTFSASVDIRQEGLVLPDTQLSVSINGTPVLLTVEKWSRERDGLTGRSLRVSGRGHNAHLDSAEARRLFTNTGVRTAAQLANEALTVNGQPIGYAIDWQLDDWAVPAGGFVHQGTPISALLAIANAAGGYLLPHASQQLIRVLPEYPALPWDWAATPADFVLPADVTSRESLTRITKPAYNGVTVRGEAGGVEVFVRRAGTSGNVEAPMVVDDLLTAKIAADQRGATVLADTGDQMEVGLRLPVLPATGIILPGALVQYSDGAATYKGLVRSVNVEATFPDVWQVIGVETHA